MIWIGWAIAGVYTVVKHDGIQLDKLRGPVLCSAGWTLWWAGWTCWSRWDNIFFVRNFGKKYIYILFAYTPLFTQMGIGIFILWLHGHWQGLLRLTWSSWCRSPRWTVVVASYRREWCMWMSCREWWMLLWKHSWWSWDEAWSLCDLFNIVLINKLYCLRWCAMLLNVDFILILFTLKISELFGLCKDI